jgi:hypothetical protein
MLRQSLKSVSPEKMPLTGFALCRDEFPNHDGAPNVLGQWTETRRWRIERELETSRAVPNDAAPIGWLTRCPSARTSIKTAANAIEARRCDDCSRSIGSRAHVNSRTYAHAWASPRAPAATDAGAPADGGAG